jgi:hypothetical protein
MTNQQFSISAGFNQVTLNLGSGGNHRCKFFNAGTKNLFFNVGITPQNSGSWASFISSYVKKGRKITYFNPYEDSNEDLLILPPNSNFMRDIVTSDGNCIMQVGTASPDTSTLVVQEGL